MVTISVDSLVLLVVVVVASWFVSLLISYSCWLSYHSYWFPSTHSYCVQCAGLLDQQDPESRLGYRSHHMGHYEDGEGVDYIEGRHTDHLDRDTTVSRSFKKSPVMTREAYNIINNRTKLSEVRVLASPSPDQKLLTPVISRTPGNAVRSRKRSTNRNMISSTRLSRVLLQKLEDKAPTYKEFPKTSELAESPLVAGSVGRHVIVNQGERNLSVPRKERGDGTAVRGITGGQRERNWSDPRKERGAGSPGHTATPQVLLEQYKLAAKGGRQPLLVDIVLNGLKSGPATDQKPATRRVINKGSVGSSSAPPVKGTVGLIQREFRRLNGRRSTTDCRSYRPGYSESDLTSQSEDDTKLRAWAGRGLLDIPPRPPSVTPPASPLSPPLLDISPFPPNSDMVSPEMARPSPGPPQVSLDISSIHLARSPVNMSQHGSVDLSPAQGLAHSSANYDLNEEGKQHLDIQDHKVVDQVFESNDYVNNATLGKLTVGHNPTDIIVHNRDIKDEVFHQGSTGNDKLKFSTRSVNNRTALGPVPITLRYDSIDLLSPGVGTETPHEKANYSSNELLSPQVEKRNSFYERPPSSQSDRPSSSLDWDDYHSDLDCVKNK